MHSFIQMKSKHKVRYENSLQLALTEKNVIENFKWTEQQMASLSQITCICIGTNEAARKVNCKFRSNKNYHSKRYIYFIGSSKYYINIHLHQSFFLRPQEKKRSLK